MLLRTRFLQARSRIIRPVSRAGLSLLARTLPGRPLQPTQTQQKPQLCRFRSTPSTMARTSGLKQILTPTLFENVLKLWFAHVCEESLILPSGSEMGKWFTRDEAFDHTCVKQFRPALEALINSEASASDILSAVNPSSPLEWLSILILLDQIPRNCYRGDESKIVFGRFDPLAEAIALQALKQNVPTQTSYLKYRLAYRIWFHMPLMHSESLAVHEQAIQVQEDIARDMDALLAQDGTTLTEEERECHSALASKADIVQKFLTQNIDYEKRHKVIIEQFGRYPHRNQALGRTSTPAEIEYLENGGETFG